jgi:hypothetical protein
MANIRPNYQVIAGDWQQLESIINDLTQRFVTQPMSTSSNPIFKRITLTETTLSPFIITSTRVNTNLNADLLDGQHASAFLTLDQTAPQTMSGGAFASSGLIKLTSGLLGVDTNTYYKSGDTPTFAKLITSETINVSITAPNDVYTVNNLIGIILSTPYAITITGIKVSCDADPTTEITGDLKYADAMIGLGTPTLINAIDTTTGAYTSGALSVSVAAGKFIYIVFDTAPSVLIKNIHIQITKINQ